MNKEKLEGLTRHIATFIGGVIVAKGWISEDIMTEVIGVAVSIFGIIWSIKSKN